MDGLDDQDFEAGRQAVEDEEAALQAVPENLLRVQASLNALQVPESLHRMRASLSALQVPVGVLQRAVENVPKVNIAPLVEASRSVDQALAGLDLTRSRLADISLAYAPTPEVSAITGLRADIRSMATLVEAQVDTTSAMLSGIEELARLQEREERREERAERRETRRSRTEILLACALLVVAALAVPGLIEFVQKTVSPVLSSHAVPLVRYLFAH